MQAFVKTVNRRIEKMNEWDRNRENTKAGISKQSCINYFEINAIVVF